MDFVRLNPFRFPYWEYTNTKKRKITPTWLCEWTLLHHIVNLTLNGHNLNVLYVMPGIVPGIWRHQNSHRPRHQTIRVIDSGLHDFADFSSSTPLIPLSSVAIEMEYCEKRQTCEARETNAYRAHSDTILTYGDMKETVSVGISAQSHRQHVLYYIKVRNPTVSREREKFAPKRWTHANEFDEWGERSSFKCNGWIQMVTLRLVVVHNVSFVVFVFCFSDWIEFWFLLIFTR